MTKLLTPEETAELLNVSIKLLNDWRYNQKVNLPYVKIGKLVRYKLSDVEQFIQGCCVQMSF